MVSTYALRELFSVKSRGAAWMRFYATISTWLTQADSGAFLINFLGERFITSNVGRCFNTARGFYFSGMSNLDRAICRIHDWSYLLCSCLNTFCLFLNINYLSDQSVCRENYFFLKSIFNSLHRLHYVKSVTIPITIPKILKRWQLMWGIFKAAGFGFILFQQKTSFLFRHFFQPFFS